MLRILALCCWCVFADAAGVAVSAAHQFFRPISFFVTITLSEAESVCGESRELDYSDSDTVVLPKLWTGREQSGYGDSCRCLWFSWCGVVELEGFVNKRVRMLFGVFGTGISSKSH